MNQVKSEVQLIEMDNNEGVITKAEEFNNKSEV